MLTHLQLIDEADLAFPIILSADGSVMDGMHRVAKSVRQAVSAVTKLTVRVPTRVWVHTRRV
jgi:hypothetical protein